MKDYQLVSRDCLLQVYERGIKSDSLLVCLHGGPGSGAKAIMELPAFQKLEQLYHCIYFDQRGSGHSSYDLHNGLSKEQMIQDVCCVIEDCHQRYEPKHIYVWGGSFGGLLAMLCVECYPNLVDGLILCNPAVTFSREEALAFFERTSAPMKARLQGLLPTVSKELEEPEAMFQEPGFQSFIFSTMNPSNSLRHIAAMSSWFYHYHATTFFQNLCIPTLLMLGEEDAVCDHHKTLEAVKNNPSPFMKYQVFTNAGHAIFIDACDAFVSAIAEFIPHK